MSTDFPYAFGTPPWDDPEADAYEDAVSDTAYGVSKDLEDIIKEAILEVVEDYFDVPDKYADYILDDKEEFKYHVTDEVIKMYLKIYKR